MTNRTRLIAGAFVAAAVAVPLYAAAASTDTAQVTATPACLAWVGNKDDGKCLSYSNGNGINVQSPQFNYCPGGNPNNNSNCGVQTGPLMPSQTWTTPIG
jgi:hypothetical protein